MTYFKANREGTVFEYMAKKRPSAFLLLFLIAKRAKRTIDHPDKSLEIGEAYIGDYETYGVTKQIYRTDKAFLKSTGQVTYKTTNKGTIARLIKTDLFNINEEEPTHELTRKLTQHQHSTNTQLTPNKNDKNDKNDKDKKTLNEQKKDPGVIPLHSLMGKFNEKYKTRLLNFGKQGQALKQILKEYTEDDIWDCADWLYSQSFWQNQGFDFSIIASQLPKFKMVKNKPSVGTPTLPVKSHDKYSDEEIFKKVYAKE